MEDEQETSPVTKSKSPKTAIIVVSCLLAIALVGVAVFLTRPAGTPGQRTVSQSELAAGTGKNGQPCLVAVDGTVYKIEGFALWQNGEHETSNGEAYCGADLTEAIGKSPHGRSKLEQLEKIGPLGS